MSNTQTIKNVREEIQSIVADIAAEYAKQNGEFCHRCNGKGYRVVWDTMDVMDGGCHESAGCDNPDCNAKSTGGDSSKLDKYDSFHNVVWAERESVATPEQAAELKRLREQHKRLREQI